MAHIQTIIATFATTIMRSFSHTYIMLFATGARHSTIRLTLLATALALASAAHAETATFIAPDATGSGTALVNADGGHMQDSNNAEATSLRGERFSGHGLTMPFRQGRPPSHPGAASLEAGLPEIQALGYASENGEYRIGLRSVSAPVFDVNGQAAYAVCVVGMFRRVNSPELERAAGLLLDYPRPAISTQDVLLGALREVDCRDCRSLALLREEVMGEITGRNDPAGLPREAVSEMFLDNLKAATPRVLKEVNLLSLIHSRRGRRRG